MRLAACLVLLALSAIALTTVTYAIARSEGIAFWPATAIAIAFAGTGGTGPKDRKWARHGGPALAPGPDRLPGLAIWAVGVGWALSGVAGPDTTGPATGRPPLPEPPRPAEHGR